MLDRQLVRGYNLTKRLKEETRDDREVFMTERTAAALRFVNAPWLRPLIFLLLIVVMWDLAIRIFKIPPYQIPAPKDVVITLWQEGPMLSLIHI